MASKCSELDYSVYKVSGTGEIFLFDEIAELSTNQRAYRTSCRASVKMLPRPRTVFELGDSHPLPHELFNDFTSPLHLDIPGMKISTEIQCMVFSPNPSGARITAVPAVTPVSTNCACRLRRVIFHVINFWDFLNNKPVPLASGKGPPDRKRQILNADGWRISINDMETTAGAIAGAKATGGYGITHTGCAERADGEPFSTDDALNLMSALRYYLSFCRGLWTGPTLPVGLDEHESIVWQRFDVDHTAGWQSCQTWFDCHHGSLLSEVFPGFFSLWLNPKWAQPLRKAIYWYIVSNRLSAGIDGSLVLTQAALEVLSWTSSRALAQPLSNSKLERLGAHQRICSLLAQLGIPLDVPPGLVDLAKVAKEAEWETGPQALTRIRNRIVHAKTAPLAGASSNAYIADAWILGQWYVELALLRLFGHMGCYSSRLISNNWVGKVSRVPWSPGS